jgi:hypothetical protein
MQSSPKLMTKITKISNIMLQLLMKFACTYIAWYVLGRRDMNYSTILTFKPLKSLNLANGARYKLKYVC